MTLRMADGPVADLPPGMDAYAGYVNESGIGITWPGVLMMAAKELAVAFSITTNGSPAQCADVESGAMSDWTGYSYGYCSVSNVNALIARFGRPKKLWTAHQDPALGRHICSPLCWPGLVTEADGTQWIDHGGWDESVLLDHFFELAPPPPKEYEIMDSVVAPDGAIVSHAVGAVGSPIAGHYLEITRSPGKQGLAPQGTVSVIDLGVWDPQLATIAPG
jgi:hypothetical protein